MAGPWEGGRSRRSERAGGGLQPVNTIHWCTLPNTAREEADEGGPCVRWAASVLPPGRGGDTARCRDHSVRPRIPHGLSKTPTTFHFSPASAPAADRACVPRACARVACAGKLCGSGGSEGTTRRTSSSSDVVGQSVGACIPTCRQCPYLAVPAAAATAPAPYPHPLRHTSRYSGRCIPSSPARLCVGRDSSTFDRTLSTVMLSHK